jgi:hypothetical protein
MRIKLMLSFLTILFLSGSICLAQGTGTGLCGDNLAWVLQDSTLTISGSGEMSQFSQSNPSPWNTNTLRTYVKKVIIQAPITKISEHAFTGLPSLVAVEFPGSVTEITSRAFYKCDRLTSISALTDVKNYGEEAFSECTALELPYVDFSKVEYMGKMAFYGCTGLKSIRLPSNVRESAFANSGISGVSGGEGLKIIPIKLFQGCKNLTSITLPSTITAIRTAAFDESGLTSINIPESVTSIDIYAFRNSALTTIRLPSGLTTLGENVLQSTKLTAVTIPSGITKIPVGTFIGCEELISVDLPAGITEIGGGAFGGCKKLSSVTLPASLERLANGVFARSGLESIHIPEKVIQIGDQVFSNCEKLAAIHVDNANSAYLSDDGVLFNKAKTTLLQYPANKTGDKYTIPSTVNTIGSRAFDLSVQLKYLVIPENVLAIGTAGIAGFWKEGVTVETENKIPLTLANNTFISYYGDGTYGTPMPATLVVPDGTATLYKNAFQWECFEKIIEKSMADANEPIATTRRLRLYPNPVKDNLTIEHTGVSSGRPIVIYNINGTAAVRTETGESVTRINISHLPGGIYLISIDGKSTAKFVKNE